MRRNFPLLLRPYLQKQYFSSGKPHTKKFRAAGGESLFSPHNRDELLSKIQKERLEKAETEEDTNPALPETGKLNDH